MPQNQLSQHIASRERSLDFFVVGSGMLLPNPDPILKAKGQDIRVYRDMRAHAHVGGCIRRRKSAVLALDRGLDQGRAASRITKAVQEMLDGLDLDALIGWTQDACLYGYQPLEVMWQPRGGMWLPHKVEAKLPEQFGFDGDNQLRFKSREAPFHGELLPARKFLLPRQEPSYSNPYGLADLSMCFWPLVFLKGGMKFWLAFAEKFGSAFSVGKLPRSASDKERQQLLDSLEALIQDGVATIPDDGSVELMEMAGKSASSDLYKDLVMHCRSDIAIALLGQNQSTEASANRASATAGLEVTRELRDADAKLAASTINQLIQWFCEVNFSGAVAPTYNLWDQEAQDKLQAERDKSNHDAGARFTNAYFMRTYGYQEGDLLPESALAAPMAQGFATGQGGRSVLPGADPNADPAADPAAFAESGSAADPLAQDTEALAQASGKQWLGLLAQLQRLVAQANSLTELQTAIVAAYGGMDAPELVNLMSAAMALAQLKGMDAVDTTLDNTPGA